MDGRQAAVHAGWRRAVWTTHMAIHHTYSAHKQVNIHDAAVCDLSASMTTCERRRLQWYTRINKHKHRPCSSTLTSVCKHTCMQKGHCMEQRATRCHYFCRCLHMVMAGETRSRPGPAWFTVPLTNPLWKTGKIASLTTKATAGKRRLQWVKRCSRVSVCLVTYCDQITRPLSHSRWGIQRGRAECKKKTATAGSHAAGWALL